MNGKCPAEIVATIEVYTNCVSVLIYCAGSVTGRFNDVGVTIMACAFSSVSTEQFICPTFGPVAISSTLALYMSCRIRRLGYGHRTVVYASEVLGARSGWSSTL